jgi:hypothetical protein
MDRKLLCIQKAFSRIKCAGEGGSVSLLDSSNISLDDEDEEEVHFCVELPVKTFEDFEKLEEELKESSRKRKLLVSRYSCFQLQSGHHSWVLCMVYSALGHF